MIIPITQDVPADPREELESFYNGRIFSTEEFRQELPDLWGWMERDLSRFGNLAALQILLSVEHSDGGIHVYLFTATNEYSLYVNAEKDYLGAMVSDRMPLTGERWERGNDLTDGPYSEATWADILHDIVATELLPLEIGYVI